MVPINGVLVASGFGGSLGLFLFDSLLVLL